ncbi:phosphate ABC transporter substrate-binding protein [Rhodoferax ferrireducens]|uniref:phosphate ABC transporter substrate-binding protein n=1 Tax=Rhodoferax ferrireducens TaxID=192843 RepID=UPI0018E51F55|nr:phosphate ABC transporter substrate-binding protein [Rhodoferax ferrireducens]
MSPIGLTLIGLTLGLCASATAADVVAVVSANGPVATLSKNQVVDIFLGKASRFPDGRLAVPIDQAEGSAARDEFYTTFAGKSPAQLKAHWSKIIFTGRGQPPIAVPNSIDVKKHVAETPNTIGYIERNLVDGSVKVLPIQ